MNDVLRELHRKMDEIIGRQERSLSVLTAIQVNCFRLLIVGECFTQQVWFCGFRSLAFHQTMNAIEWSMTCACQNRTKALVAFYF